MRGSEWGNGALWAIETDDGPLSRIGRLSQMAGRKRPSEIFLVWDSIVFPETGYESPTSERGRQTFDQIWQSRGADGKYKDLDPEDAGLLCSLGWKLAMERADYEESLEWTRLMPLHPRFSDLDSIGKIEPMRDAFYSHAYLGDIEQLCNVTRILCEQPQFMGWRYSSGILFLDEVFPPDSPVDSRILEVAKRVVGTKKRYSHLVRKLEKSGITYGEMREVGMKTLNRTAN